MLRRSAGRLETDDTATNDDDADLAMERLAQMHRVFDATKIVNLRTRSLERFNTPRLGAGRKKEPVVTEDLAVAGCNGLSLCIACDDGGSGDHCNVEHSGPVACRLEIGNRSVQRCEQFLGQLRALIGRMLLLTDHRNGAAKAGGAQRFRRTSSRLAGASDHYFFDGRHRRFKLPGARYLLVWPYPGSGLNFLRLRTH